MISFAQLWIPVLATAVGVFVASSLIHMVFKWHQSEYRKLPNEDEVRSVMRAVSAAPGQYFIPYCSDPKEMQKPEMLQKFQEGPIGLVTLRPAAMPSLGKPLVLWFLMSLVVASVAGYLAAHTVPAGASFLAVARVVGIVTFLAYATGPISAAVWWGKPWSSALKEALDAFIYAVVTAVTFGSLWPR